MNNHDPAAAKKRNQHHVSVCIHTCVQNYVYIDVHIHIYISIYTYTCMRDMCVCIHAPYRDFRKPKIMDSPPFSQGAHATTTQPGLRSEASLLSTVMPRPPSSWLFCVQLRVLLGLAWGAYELLSMFRVNPLDLDFLQRLEAGNKWMHIQCIIYIYIFIYMHIYTPYIGTLCPS